MTQPTGFPSELVLRPWIRFWSRIFDILLVFCPCAILLDVSLPVWRDTYWLQVLWVWPLACAIWVPIEAFCMTTWGTTPGKRLLHIRVLPSHKGIVTYEEAIRRAGRVYFYGMGMGLIFLQPFFLFASYRRLTQFAITRWDAEIHTRVEHGKISVLRGWIFAILLILLEGLGPALSGQISKGLLLMQPTDLKWK